MPDLKKILRLVRNALFGALNREFLIFLFFLALSGMFWLMMTLNETYEADYPVVVRVTGVPKNVVMTSEATDTIRVTVRDKGYMLFAYNYGKDIRPVVFNFNTYANRQTGHGIIPLADLQKAVRQQLYASTTLVSIKSGNFDFYFNYGEKKTVTVQLQGNIVPANNYYLAHVQFNPERVTIYAAPSRLDSIKGVLTEYLNIVDFEDTVTRTVHLKHIPGVKIVPQVVQVTLFPDILTEASMEVPITTINKPEELVIRTFPQRVKVNFSVGASMFRRVRPDDFMVVVDYREVQAHPSDKCNIYLKSSPRIVTGARLEINRVDYLIEQQ